MRELRQEYCSKSLDIKDLIDDPFLQFSHWFQEARMHKIIEPNAMILATVSKDSKPSTRTVLLKGIHHKKFEFFTNLKSRKAHELAENPFASATFLWKELERQVTIEGTVESIPQEICETYFQSRPRGSQLGAHVSKQGSFLASRQELDDRFKELEKQYETIQRIPLPIDWGGYYLVPNRFEFWQGRPNRLHDRFEYRLLDRQWQIQRLSP